MSLFSKKEEQGAGSPAGEGECGCCGIRKLECGGPKRFSGAREMFVWVLLGESVGINRVY